MRFEQLKRQPNAILRKKLYKSGKSWVIASTLAFAGGMILLGSAQGTTVKADVTDGGIATEGTATAPSNNGKTDGSNTETEEDSGSTKTETQPSDVNSDKGTGDSAGTTQGSTGFNIGSTASSSTGKTQASAVPATGSINGDNTDTVQSDKAQQAAPVVQSDDTGINDPNNIATSINYGNVGANNDFAGSSWYINQGVLHIGAGTWGDINGFNWGNDPSKVKSLYFDGPVTAGSSISGLFSGLTNLSSVGNMKGNFDTSKTTDFSTMFMNSGLTSFDFSILNMSNAIEISSMFENTNITSVNLSSINAPNLLNCSRMFANTAELKAANLSDFNFYSSDIQYMFTQSGLNSINLSGINTSNTKNDYGVFDGDTKLVDLDLSDFTMNTQTLEYGYNLLLFLGSQPADHVTLNDVKIHSLTLNPTLNLADSGLVFNTNLYKGWVSDKNPTADPISSEKLMSEYDGTNSPKEIQTWTLVKKDPVKPYNLTVNISYDDNPKKDTQLLILPGNPEDISNDSVFQSDLDKLPNNNQTLDLDTTTFDLSTLNGPLYSSVHFRDFAEALKLSDTEKNLRVIINALVDLLKQQGMLSKGGDGSPINFVDAHYKTYEAPAVTPPVHNGGSSSSNSSNSSATEPDREVDDVNQTSATYSDSPKAQLYDFDGNALEDEFLNQNTSWYNDKKMILNGTTYYRVSTDKWVKASDVYIYVGNNTYVRVYQNALGELVNAHGSTVSRELKSSTDWKSDRAANINGEKYYRVATNEFVKASDVYEYSYDSPVVSTTETTGVYDERGNATTTRLSTNSSYKTDRYEMINGEKYYRIATDQFVKSEDVNL